MTSPDLPLKPQELLLLRVFKGPEYTIGRLYLDGLYLFNSLEDPDRGLDCSDLLSEIQRKKIHGKTAIPTGRYEVVLTYSNRFKQLMPLLLGVPGFSGVRIHPGNTTADTAGCVLVGSNTSKGILTLSKKAYRELRLKLNFSTRKIFITVQ